jgi:hypothetical protein
MLPINAQAVQRHIHIHPAVLLANTLMEFNAKVLINYFLYFQFVISNVQLALEPQVIAQHAYQPDQSLQSANVSLASLI